MYRIVAQYDGMSAWVPSSFYSWFPVCVHFKAHHSFSGMVFLSVNWGLEVPGECFGGDQKLWSHKDSISPKSLQWFVLTWMGSPAPSPTD